MPTGYTAIIGEKDDATFEEFASRCARNFGALIALRDEPMSNTLPEDVGFKSTFHKDAMNQAAKDFGKYSLMSIEDAEFEAEVEYRQQVAQKKEWEENKAKLRQKYEAMLRQVDAWTPPTPDHQGLKDFMVKQIRESIEFDCPKDLYSSFQPTRKTGVQWRQEKLDAANASVERHRKQMEEDEARDRERNEWVRQLRDSLRPKAASV